MAASGRKTHDEKLIVELAAGASWERAAAACGCSQRTIARRLNDPEFRAALDEARRQIFENAFARVLSAGQAAASTLISLLRSDTPPAVRLGAARTLLESTCRFRETHVLEERLRALELKLGASA